MGVWMGGEACKSNAVKGAFDEWGAVFGSLGRCGGSHEVFCGEGCCAGAPCWRLHACASIRTQDGTRTRSACSESPIGGK